jgi:hypothetical protein
MELGALGVIAKPFDPMTLAKTVRELLATTLLRTVVGYLNWRHRVGR